MYIYVKYAHINVYVYVRNKYDIFIIKTSTFYWTVGGGVYDKNLFAHKTCA